MNSGEAPSSDRLTVIFLVLVCIISILLVSCAVYFLYFYMGPALASPSPRPANLPDNASVVSTPVPAAYGNFAGNRAYICQYMSQTMPVLDVDTGSLVDEIHLPMVAYGVAASHDGKYVYVSCSRHLYIVDSRTDQIINSIFTRDHTSVGHLAVSPDDRYLYVACTDGIEIIALNGSEGEQAAFMSGSYAAGIGISPDGMYVYASDWNDCLLHVYNTTDRRLEKTIDLIPDYLTHEYLSLRGTPIQAAGQAGGIAVSPDGSRAIVGIWYGTFVSAVDLKALTLEKAVHLYNQSNRCPVYSPDGSRIYLSRYGDGTIVMLNGSTFQEVNYFSVGSWPVSIAITPNGRYLYVTYQQSDMDIYRLPDGAHLRTLNITAGLSGTNIAFVPAAI